MLHGTSGDEAEQVTPRIIELLPDGCEYKTDALGNLIVTKKGEKAPKNKVMLAAHQDEVGFIVTYINADGTLKIAPVGGISPEVVPGRRLVFKNGTVGIVGGKAVHQQTDDEKAKLQKFSDMNMDIGAKNKEQAEKHVAIGDCAYFEPNYAELGNGIISAKALDDRAGCAIMLRLLAKELPYDVTCVFTVQEEIGTRGAKTAAYTVNPDYALVLETTTACDFAGNEGEKRVCELNRGCVISYMDRATIYPKELYRLAFSKAEQKGIPCQTKTMVAGGNDSGAIHTAVGGIKTLALSVPCRYLHSPCCAASKSDIEATERLAYEMYVTLCEL